MKKLIFIVMIVSSLFAKSQTDIDKIEQTIINARWTACGKQIGWTHEERKRVITLLKDTLIGDAEIEVIKAMIETGTPPGLMRLAVKDMIRRNSNDTIPNVYVENPKPIVATQLAANNSKHVPHLLSNPYDSSAKFALVCCSVQDLQLMVNTYIMEDFYEAYPQIEAELKNLNVVKTTVSSKANLLTGIRKTDRYYSYVLRETRKDPTRPLPLNFIRAKIVVESMGNPKAKSPAGAGGLMQLMPGTAKKYGCTNRYDLQQNIRAGCAYARYLAYDCKKTNTHLDFVLAGWNWGENRTTLQQKNTWPNETRKFVANVRAIYQIFDWIDQINQQPQLAKK